MIQFTTQEVFSPEPTTSIVILKDISDLNDIIRVLPLYNYAALNDIVIVKDGLTVTEVFNHKTELLEYLNGVTDEFIY